MAADRRARFSVADVTAVKIQEESAVFVAADKRINVLKEDLLLPSTKAAKILCGVLQQAESTSRPHVLSIESFRRCA